MKHPPPPPPKSTTVRIRGWIKGDGYWPTNPPTKFVEIAMLDGSSVYVPPEAIVKDTQ